MAFGNLSIIITLCYDRIVKTFFTGQDIKTDRFDRLYELFRLKFITFPFGYLDPCLHIPA